MNASNNTSEVINFGKFKGTALVELKRSYVSWLLSLQNLDSALRKKLEDIEAERKRDKQRRAELFSQPCFQRTRYSANQRIAYNNQKYN